MSIFLKFGWRFLSSRIGLAAALCALLWGWHIHDKRQAVATAREGYVREFELNAARFEVEALRRRVVAAEAARQALQEQIRAAEGEALRFAEELERFKRETEINPDGVVDSDLLRRLRSN